MSDDIGPEDGRHVTLTREGEVQYWTDALGCTEDELFRAVNEVGNSAPRLRQYFTEQRASDITDPAPAVEVPKE